MQISLLFTVDDLGSFCRILHRFCSSVQSKEHVHFTQLVTVSMEFSIKSSCYTDNLTRYPGWFLFISDLDMRCWIFFFNFPLPQICLDGTVNISDCLKHGSAHSLGAHRFSGSASLLFPSHVLPSAFFLCNFLAFTFSIPGAGA